MNPVTTGRKADADAGTRVGADKVVKITSAADSGRIRIVKWSRSKRGMFDGEGCHKFDVSLEDGRSGHLFVDLNQLPEKADCCVRAFVYHEGKCEYLTLLRLELASDMSELVLGMILGRSLTLLGGCVCTPVFRGLLQSYVRFFAAAGVNARSSDTIAVLKSGATAVSYLERNDYGSVAKLFRMPPCELTPCICGAMAGRLEDLHKAAKDISSHGVMRYEARAMGACARGFIRSVNSIGRAAEMMRDQLGFKTAAIG